MRRLAHFTLIVTLVGYGCQRGSARKLADTEGRTFDAQCSPESGCRLTQTSGPGQGEPVSLTSRGRLFGACSAADGATAAAGDCRPLVCQDDDGCPPAHGLSHGTCVNGLCVEPSHELTADDSVMLCLSGTGLGRSAPVQVERFALGLNCGTPCRVPRTCRQP